MTDVPYRRAAALFEAPIGDELVALDEARGLCFGFNDSAAAVWQALATPRSLDELVRMMVAKFEVEAQACRTDLEVLLDEMVASGLIARGA